MTITVTALGIDDMALFAKLSRGFGCASLALTLPMLAAATGSGDPVEATHFVSSGRIVNVVADTTPQAQADSRAAIWALTRQVQVPNCAVPADAPCFGTFQTGAAQ